jgi:hypothetical protein
VSQDALAVAPEADKVGGQGVKASISEDFDSMRLVGADEIAPALHGGSRSAGGERIESPLVVRTMSHKETNHRGRQ